MDHAYIESELVKTEPKANMLYHLNVKTTTFVNRNIELFQNVADKILDQTQTGLRILEVGPGMAVRGIGRLNHLGSWKLAKRIETVVRRLPLPVPCYENYETKEILDVFARFSPRLTVADISKKSLNVINHNITGNLEKTIELDVATNRPEILGQLYNRFDLVICLATVVRIPPHLRALANRNLGGFCAPGAVVISEQNMTAVGLDPVVGFNKVYRKPACAVHE